MVTVKSLKNLSRASLLKSHVSPTQIKSAGYPPKVVNNYKPYYQKLKRYEKDLRQVNKKLNALKKKEKQLIENLNFEKYSSYAILKGIQRGNQPNDPYLNRHINNDWKNSKEYKQLRYNLKKFQLQILSIKPRMNTLENSYHNWVENTLENLSKEVHRRTMTKKRLEKQKQNLFKGRRI